MDSILIFLKKHVSLIGILLFIVILSRLDLTYYKDLMLKVNLWKVGLLCFAVLISSFIKSYRWLNLMKVQGIYYSFWQSFLMYQASVYAGLFTPGRIGEAGRALYLKKDHSYGRAFVSIAVDRLMDMALLLIFSFIGLFLFLQIFKKGIFVFFVLIFAIFLCAVIFWKSGFARSIFKKIFYFFLPQKYQSAWQMNFQDFLSDIKAYKSVHYIYAFILTLVIWYIYYAVLYLFAKDIGINQIPFLFFSSALSVASLIAFLPISISGIGTRDAALLAMFSLFNVSKELTIAVSMLILLLTFFNAFVGLLCWIKKPLFRD